MVKGQEAIIQLLEEELRQLREENATLKIQVDALKRANEGFAKKEKMRHERKIR